METALELIEKLKSYYHAERMNPELEDGIKSFIRRKNLNSIELESLYDIIRDNCGKMPNVQYIAKLWKEYGQRAEKVTAGFASRAISENKNSGWEKVIDQIKRIRRKQEHSELTNSEIDILHDYEELSTVYFMLNAVPSVIMPEQYKATYLRKVKEDVDNHIPVNLTAARVKIEKRINDYNMMYGPEESEILGNNKGISKSFEQMQKAFGERKQALDPEPDKQMNLVI